jgi:lysophospholipid acyltransferase (LPLAT)-like uncharacterized protein
LGSARGCFSGEPRVRFRTLVAAWVVGKEACSHETPQPSTDRGRGPFGRYRLINQDDHPHPADADKARYIYAFWHETFLAPVMFRARVRILISQHADGELIAQAAQRLGFGVVRGSTTRGGGRALAELWDCSQSAHLIFTPDGPRGPRRQIQLGMILLASLSGVPIVPVGVGYSRCWRAGSWDRFAVPKPFARVVFVAAKAIHVPGGLDRGGLEPYRAMVEARMLEATETAEREAVTQRTPRPHFFRRGRAARQRTNQS